MCVCEFLLRKMADRISFLSTVYLTLPFFFQTSVRTKMAAAADVIHAHLCFSFYDYFRKARLGSRKKKSTEPDDTTLFFFGDFQVIR